MRDTCCVKVANRVWRPLPSTYHLPPGLLLRNALHPRENTRDTMPCQNAAGQRLALTHL